MELKLSVSEKNEAERLVLVGAIGLLESLEHGVLTIEDCENYLFNLYSVSILEGKKLDTKVIEVIELGCELEDVQSLVPEKLQDEIKVLKEQAKECLKNSPPSEDPYNVEKWMDK